MAILRSGYRQPYRIILPRFTPPCIDAALHGTSTSPFIAMTKKAFPSFDELPLDKSGPPGNAWGLWGHDDELGMLNLLTPEVITAAASEIKEGVRISLDWPLDKPSFPTFERRRLHHAIINKAPMTMNDDAIHINTQSSTQWDGFRHYGRRTFGSSCRGERLTNDRLPADEAILQRT